MATYTELAPEISSYISEETATTFVENQLSSGTPTYNTLSDLSGSERSEFFTWLKWFGMSRKPNNLSNIVGWSPRKIARYFKMTPAYVRSLIAEKNAVVSEVLTWGEYAFVPHIAPVISNMVVNGEGDITITGTTMLSLAADETSVTFRRNTNNVTKTKTQIEANGGSVTDTEIVIINGTLPVALQTDDAVQIVANGFTSEEYIVS